MKNSINVLFKIAETTIREVFLWTFSMQVKVISKFEAVSKGLTNLEKTKYWKSAFLPASKI